MNDWLPVFVPARNVSLFGGTAFLKKAVELLCLRQRLFGVLAVQETKDHELLVVKRKTIGAVLNAARFF